jgi:uncharacterized protein involved in exopolysaccharide biosynthesis
MTTASDYLDDEIDLRELVRTLLRFKWWIVGLTVVALLAGYLVSKFLLPKQYAASALVVITKPVFTANLDPRIQVSAQTPDAKALTEITKADDLLQAIVASPELAGMLDPDTTPAALGGQLEVRLIGVSQLQLVVTDTDPARAAKIANLWAEQVATRLNDLYDLSENSLTQFEQLTDEAYQGWEVAEQALAQQIPQSQVEVLQVTLRQSQDSLRAYLDKNLQLDLVISDARALQARLQAQSLGAALLTGDALTLINIQQNVVSLGASSGLQIQITDPAIFGEQYTIAEALTNLETLITSLQSQQSDLAASIETLKTRITEQAVALETAQFQISQFTVQRDLALSTYQALSNQTVETRIGLSQGNQAAKVAALALPPSVASGPRATVNALIAGGMAFVLTIFGALAINWWRSPEKPETPQKNVGQT